MCQAFSCLVTKSGKVYWKRGEDGHDTLWSTFKDQDKDLTETGILRRDQRFARVEIAPQNGNYLDPDKWTFQVDQEDTPSWLNESLEKKCFEAKDAWLKQVYAQIDLKAARNLIHPFKVKPPKKITEKHLKLLKEWASVWDSVWASVWASVRASVGDSVRDSVWASVRAYTGSLFPKIIVWGYVDRTKPPFNKIKGYPFKSAIALWMIGLVSSFDGKVWRLHGGPDGKVLWEGTLKEAA